MAKTEKYKFVGNHVSNLDSGQTLEVGQEVDLTSDEAGAPIAASMIDDGTLIVVEEPKEEPKAKASSRCKGEEDK